MDQQFKEGARRREAALGGQERPTNHQTLGAFRYPDEPWRQGLEGSFLLPASQGWVQRCRQPRPEAIKRLE